MLIPIGTDIRLHRRPVGNYVLVALNVLVYLATNQVGLPLVDFALPPLNATAPSVYEYVSYQFRHADFFHLAGNMLFLWIFGNAVCARMGSIPYAVFYIAGGIFSGWIFVLNNENPLVGASGSIAAVTTAFLVLFPKTHITLLLWLIIITTLQLPSMLFIVVKIILWDNIIAPNLSGGMTSSVAYSAHLGGYGFGFAIALFLLATKALPRDPFDLFSIWERRRRKSDMGPMFSPRDVPLARPAPERSRPPSETEVLRERLLEFAYDQDWPRAAETHRELLELDPHHTLPQPQQRQLATWYHQSQRYPEAAQAYERFLEAYSNAPDAPQIRLLVGMIYRDYLAQPADAVKHLQRAVDDLVVPELRRLAEQELALAREQLGPDTT